MDWLWPLDEERIARDLDRLGLPSGDAAQQAHFLAALADSTATLFVMEPVRDTIRFKGLGRWPLAAVPDLLADPNRFIAERFGGGKFKINFHHGLTFVGTHNFRTHGEPRWKEAVEVELE